MDSYVNFLKQKRNVKELFTLTSHKIYRLICYYYISTNKNLLDTFLNTTLNFIIEDLKKPINHTDFITSLSKLDSTLFENILKLSDFWTIKEDCLWYWNSNCKDEVQILTRDLIGPNNIETYHLKSSIIKDIIEQNWKTEEMDWFTVLNSTKFPLDAYYWLNVNKNEDLSNENNKIVQLTLDEFLSIIQILNLSPKKTTIIILFQLYLHLFKILSYSLQYESLNNIIFDYIDMNDTTLKIDSCTTHYILPYLSEKIQSNSHLLKIFEINQKRIDTHHHIIPPLYGEWLLKNMSTSGGIPVPFWSEQDTKELMDSVGIKTAILSVTSPGVNLGNVKEARLMARYVNNFVSDLVKGNPSRFGFFGTLTLPDVEGSLIEAAYVLDELHADGLLF
jgi:hypothetical protein